ncbi:hypothetical protein WS83_12135 [Burkholderia sp. MSMB2042]|nr:hypothetical protein WS78_31620 [Burkholderia savannae]KVG48238.1 hypothetical protein WS77_26785 [Burkholderia sp. MSMB0265]KVG84315.1 hypothetical protein WS81_06700 [Burkholderia sp. MSMB2040]KVG92185.1 hypothetical protein WS83_12135 [Burkholderia sp. MSMB2042]KVG93892.1 hypothetical protein WS82_07990 [Burkholderia sp. MSMB2041]KVK82785.1 hypothetical protein WS91_07255 [Burkholderia sp. MSMB1498]
MDQFLDTVVTLGPPPLIVSLVFVLAYLLVGIPVHCWRGAESRDVFGTLAGVFAALAYITLILSVTRNA